MKRWLKTRRNRIVDGYLPCPSCRKARRMTNEEFDRFIASLIKSQS